MTLEEKFLGKRVRDCHPGRRYSLGTSWRTAHEPLQMIEEFPVERDSQCDGASDSRSGLDRQYRPKTSIFRLEQAGLALVRDDLADLGDLLRRTGLRPRAAAWSPRVGRIQAWFGSTEATTMSPTSPGATGSSVPSPQQP
jgi:hypothetical protein